MRAPPENAKATLARRGSAKAIEKIRPPYGPHEDQSIFVTKDNAPKLVQAMLEAAGFETATTFGDSLLLPKPEPISGAQRQKRYRNKHCNGNGDARVTDRDELPLHLVAAE
jgi:hypothetical protein